MSLESHLVRIAAVQSEVREHDLDSNVQACLRGAHAATEAGADVVVLPECALTGIDYGSADEVAANSIAVDGDVFASVVSELSSLGSQIVLGFVENRTGRMHNTAALIGPGGVAGLYRKVHLPLLGADRWITRGKQAPVVVDTPVGRIGLGICYDYRFPEWIRCLALAGADIVALPTNWPKESAPGPDILVSARALENRIYLVASNRSGRSATCDWMGRSMIAGTDGAILARAGAGPGIITADCDLAQARTKSTVIRKDFRYSVMDDRAPSLYRALVE